MENRHDHSGTVTGLRLLTARLKAKGDVVNVDNTQEVTILELAKKVKETTKCRSAIEFQPCRRMTLKGAA